MFLSALFWVSLVALPFLLWAMFFEVEADQQRVWALGALGALLTAALARLLIYVMGTKIRCPLCQGAIFQAARCRMNSNARKNPLLSYSTTMVADMFLYRRFVCKYCGTPFRLRK